MKYLMLICWWSNAFISNQFYYAPLIWMCTGKLLILRVQRVHFQSLKVVHNTHDTSYNELLSIKSDVQFIRHLHFLVAEVFKSVNNLNSTIPQFMRDYLKMNFFPYDLRKGNTLQLSPAHSACHGINLLLLWGSLPWNNLPTLHKKWSLPSRI